MGPTRRVTGLKTSVGGIIQSPIRVQKSARLSATTAKKSKTLNKEEAGPCSDEKERVFEALTLMSQAYRNLEHESVLYLLDCDHDIVWDWRSVELTVDGYHTFNRVMSEDEISSHMWPFVRYDWAPFSSYSGIISVRKECSFQAHIATILADVINEAMQKNELLISLARDMALEAERRVPVRTNTFGGTRTPCRCFYYKPKDMEEEMEEEEAGKAANFVLEVGMGQKTNVLDTLARSYIQQGTLCVMTIAVQRHGKYDFDWKYSLYRRGKLESFPAQVMKYEVACDVQDARVTVENNIVTFPAALTVFDLVPPEILEENDVHRNDTKATIGLKMNSGVLQLTRGGVGVPLQKGKTMSQHLQDLYDML